MLQKISELSKYQLEENIVDEKETLIEELLDLIGDLFSYLAPTLALDRLASDITVAQLRVLLGLQRLGSSPMSSIADAAGVVPSTATGIVDNLVGKGLVLRDLDTNDRRRVICRLSPEGEELTNGIWTWGREQISNMLKNVPVEQLRTGCEGSRMILNQVSDS